MAPTRAHRWGAADAPSKALTGGSLPRVDGESTPSTDPPPPTILHRFVRCSGVTVNGQPTFEVEESDPSYDESEVSLWCTNNGLWQIGHTKYVGRNLAFLSGCMRVGEAQAHVNEPAAAPPAANLDRLEWRLHVGKNRWVDAPHFALYTDESIEQRLAAMAPTVHLVGALPADRAFHRVRLGAYDLADGEEPQVQGGGGQDDIEAKDGGDIKNTDGAQESTAAEESGGDGGRRVNGRPWYTLRRDKTYSLWWDKTGWQVGLTSDRGKRIGFIMTRESKALLPEWVPEGHFSSTIAKRRGYHAWPPDSKPSLRFLSDAVMQDTAMQGSSVVHLIGATVTGTRYQSTRFTSYHRLKELVNGRASYIGPEPPATTNGAERPALWWYEHTDGRGSWMIGNVGKMGTGTRSCEISDGWSAIIPEDATGTIAVLGGPTAETRRLHPAPSARLVSDEQLSRMIDEGCSYVHLLGPRHIDGKEWPHPAWSSRRTGMYAKADELINGRPYYVRCDDPPPAVAGTTSDPCPHRKYALWYDPTGFRGWIIGCIADPQLGNRLGESYQLGIICEGDAAAVIEHTTNTWRVQVKEEETWRWCDTDIRVVTETEARRVTEASASVVLTGWHSCATRMYKTGGTALQPNKLGRYERVVDERVNGRAVYIHAEHKRLRSGFEPTRQVVYWLRSKRRPGYRFYHPAR